MPSVVLTSKHLRVLRDAGAELTHWFPQDVEADLRRGGTMRFTFRGLTARLDGDEPPPAGGWQQVHSGNVSRFGPEAATIGPPA